MSYKRCCIPGCSGTAGSENVLHEFPNPAKDLDRFMTWIHSIGGDILKLTNKFIYKNRRVCRLHFEAKYHCRFNRLSNIAVPTINMPYLNASVPMEQMPSRQLQNLLENVPFVSSVLTTDHTSAITTEEPLRIIQNLPVNRPSSATKSDNLPIEPEMTMEYDLLSQGKENIAPSSKYILDHKSVPDTTEKIYKNQQKADTKRIKSKKVTTRRVKMTKNEQDLYKKLVSVKRKLRTYKNKLSKQAIQPKLAKKLSSNPEFVKVMENMSASAKILMMMQFRQQGKKAKGRRFDIKEKITSLSLMKQRALFH